VSYTVVLNSSRNTLKIFCLVETLTAANNLVSQRSTLTSFYGKPYKSSFPGCLGMDPLKSSAVILLLYETEAPTGCQGIEIKLL